MTFERMRTWLNLALLCLCVAGAGASLQGCASPNAVGTSGHEVLTDSDAPEAKKRAAIRMELATGYFGQGQDTVALDEVKQVLALDPGNADAFNLRGLIYLRMGETSLAEDSFLRASRLNPRDGNALHNLGWMYCQAGRYGEAKRTFDQAAAIPTYLAKARTYTAEGVCQARAGDRDGAIETLSRSYDLDPDNPTTAYNLSALLYQKADYRRAQSYIRRLNNGEMANAESLWLGMRVEKRLGNQAAVRQLGDQLGKRFGNSREMLAYERGRFDD